MASIVDSLLSNYEKVLREPWSQNLSGQEKVWFLVYDPAEQRKVALRIGDFERITLKNNRKWLEIDLQPCFADWMSQLDYNEDYFRQPEFLQDQIDAEFRQKAVDLIRDTILNNDNTENTIVAITHVSALFGFLKLSDILKDIYPHIKGRLLIFFPGEHHNNHYRLMDARDGWSYLARPITA